MTTAVPRIGKEYSEDGIDRWRTSQPQRSVDDWIENVACEIWSPKTTATKYTQTLVLKDGDDSSDSDPDKTGKTADGNPLKEGSEIHFDGRKYKIGKYLPETNERILYKNEPTFSTASIWADVSYQSLDKDLNYEKIDLGDFKPDLSKLTSNDRCGERVETLGATFYRDVRTDQVVVEIEGSDGLYQIEETRSVVIVPEKAIRSIPNKAERGGTEDGTRTPQPGDAPKADIEIIERCEIDPFNLRNLEEKFEKVQFEVRKITEDGCELQIAKPVPENICTERYFLVKTSDGRKVDGWLTTYRGVHHDWDQLQWWQCDSDPAITKALGSDLDIRIRVGSPSEFRALIIELLPELASAVQGKGALAGYVTKFEMLDPNWADGDWIKHAPGQERPGTRGGQEFAFVIECPSETVTLALRRKLNELLKAKKLSTLKSNSGQDTIDRIEMNRTSWIATSDEKGKTGALIERDVQMRLENEYSDFIKNGRLSDAGLKKIEKESGIETGQLKYDSKGGLMFCRHVEIGKPIVVLLDYQKNNLTKDLAGRKGIYFEAKIQDAIHSRFNAYLANGRLTGEGLSKLAESFSALSKIESWNLTYDSKGRLMLLGGHNIHESIATIDSGKVWVEETYNPRTGRQALEKIYRQVGKDPAGVRIAQERSAVLAKRFSKPEPSDGVEFVAVRVGLDSRAGLEIVIQDGRTAGKSVRPIKLSEQEASQLGEKGSDYEKINLEVGGEKFIRFRPYNDVSSEGVFYELRTANDGTKILTQDVSIFVRGNDGTQGARLKPSSGPGDGDISDPDGFNLKIPSAVEPFERTNTDEDKKERRPSPVDDNDRKQEANKRSKSSANGIERYVDILCADGKLVMAQLRMHPFEQRSAVLQSAFDTFVSRVDRLQNNPILKEAVVVTDRYLGSGSRLVLTTKDKAGRMVIEQPLFFDERRLYYQSTSGKTESVDLKSVKAELHVAEATVKDANGEKQAAELVGCLIQQLNKFDRLRDRNRRAEQADLDLDAFNILETRQIDRWTGILTGRLTGDRQSRSDEPASVIFQQQKERVAKGSTLVYWDDSDGRVKMYSPQDGQGMELTKVIRDGLKEQLLECEERIRTEKDENVLELLKEQRNRMKQEIAEFENRPSFRKRLTSSLVHHLEKAKTKVGTVGALVTVTYLASKILQMSEQKTRDTDFNLDVPHYR